MHSLFHIGYADAAAHEPARPDRAPQAPRAVHPPPGAPAPGRLRAHAARGLAAAAGRLDRESARRAVA